MTCIQISALRLYIVRILHVQQFQITQRISRNLPAKPESSTHLHPRKVSSLAVHFTYNERVTTQGRFPIHDTLVLYT